MRVHKTEEAPLDVILDNLHKSLLIWGSYGQSGNDVVLSLRVTVCLVRDRKE